MFIVFSGTTDYRHRLFHYLNGPDISGFTAMQSIGAWQGFPLGGDVLVFFTEKDARKASDFLQKSCCQQSAPIYLVTAHLMESANKCA